MSKIRPTPPKPIQPPKLQTPLELREVVHLESSSVIEECRIDSAAFARERAEKIRFDGVHLVAPQFEESRLASLFLVDVLCDRGNLAQIEWRGAKVTRVVFAGCRMTGAKWSEAEFDSVRFKECQGDYGSFADARFKQTVFESCQLRESDFHGADLRGVKFVSCELRGADFARAKLDGADVSESNIEGISVGPADVRGLVVNRDQASQLASLFGIVVRA